MRILSTSIHGIIDYLFGVLLIALPKLLGWNQTADYLISIVGVSIIVYSLITHYELSVYRLIPMPVHLLLDALVGLILLVGPLFFAVMGSGVHIWFMLLGLFALGVALVTELQPGAAANATSPFGSYHTHQP